MIKSLGFIETRSLVGAVASADSMLKNTDIEIIKKEHLTSGEIILILRGDASSVKLALDIGADKARELGQLILSYIIPKPLPGLEEVFPEFLRGRPQNEKQEEILPAAPEKPEQSRRSRPIKKEIKKAQIPESSTAEKGKGHKNGNEVTTKKSGKGKSKIQFTSEITVDENTGENKTPHPEDINFSLFDPSNDTISRLRREALGTGGLNPGDDLPVAAKKEKTELSGSAVQEEQRRNEAKQENETAEKYSGEDIERLNVHKLRKLARSIDNFPIRGREISRANRDELIDYFASLG